MVKRRHPRSRLLRFAGVVTLWFMAASASFGRAALEWAQKTVEVSTTFKQQDARGAFLFCNTGDTPVTITSVNSNCGCTTAELEKKTYAPGESGQINVMFEIGDYMGTHDTHILVTTDIPSAAPADLTLRVRIPEYLRLEPHMAIWQIHGEAQEKTLVCAAVANESVWLTEARSTDPAVTARIETVTPGRKYLVHLRPSSTDAHIVATIQMQATVDRVGTRVVNAYAYVTGP